MSKAEQVWEVIRKNPGITNGELIRKTGQTCPWRRVTELIQAGKPVERWQEWWQPKSGRGCWLTHYRAGEQG